MTRADREIALGVALAWFVASEAVEAAAPGSVEQSTLRATEALLSRALDREAERVNVDASDLAQEAARLSVMLSAAAVGWERRERAAMDEARRLFEARA